MAAPTLDDILVKIRNDEEIHLVSTYASNSVVVHYLFGIGSFIIGGFMFLMIMFMGRGNNEIIAIGIFLVILSFGAIIFFSGINKAEAVIKGDFIYFKSLMFRTRYKVQLVNVSNIGLVEFQGYGLSGFITAAMKIMKTTVTFQQGNKNKTLTLFNTRKWRYGEKVSVADVIWVARDEAFKKAGIN